MTAASPRWYQCLLQLCASLSFHRTCPVCAAIIAPFSLAVALLGVGDQSISKNSHFLRMVSHIRCRLLSCHPFPCVGGPPRSSTPILPTLGVPNLQRSKDSTPDRTSSSSQPQPVSMLQRQISARELRRRSSEGGLGLDAAAVPPRLTRIGGGVVATALTARTAPLSNANDPDSHSDRREDDLFGSYPRSGSSQRLLATPLTTSPADQAQHQTGDRVTASEGDRSGRSVSDAARAPAVDRGCASNGPMDKVRQATGGDRRQPAVSYPVAPAMAAPEAAKDAPAAPVAVETALHNVIDDVIDGVIDDGIEGATPPDAGEFTEERLHREQQQRRELELENSSQCAVSVSTQCLER